MTYKFAGTLANRQPPEESIPVYLGVVGNRYGELNFGFFRDDLTPVGILLRFNRLTGKLYRLSCLDPSLVEDLGLQVDDTGRITIVG